MIMFKKQWFKFCDPTGEKRIKVLAQLFVLLVVFGVFSGLEWLIRSI